MVFPDRFRLGSPAKSCAIEPYAPTTECDLKQKPKESYEPKGLHSIISILGIAMGGWYVQHAKLLRVLSLSVLWYIRRQKNQVECKGAQLGK